MLSPHLMLMLLACLLAFVCAWLSAVGGVGGGVLMMLVFTALFGLEMAVPMLAITQVASNGGRAYLNRSDVQWRLVRWHALGAIPFAFGGGLMLAYVPVEPLKRLLGAFLVAAFVWRRLRPTPARLGERAFIAIGGATGLGSSLLGAAGPLAAPFFLAYGLVGGAYIGTEAAASLVIQSAKVAAYGAGNLLSLKVFLIAAALIPAVFAGAWVGRRTVQRLSNRVFVWVIEIGMLVGGIGFLAGL